MMASEESKDEEHENPEAEDAFPVSASTTETTPMKTRTVESSHNAAVLLLESPDYSSSFGGGGSVGSSKGALSPRPDYVSVSSISSISLAPDLQLDGMKLVVQKELPKLSVDRYYQTFWVEEKTGFLKSCLVADGKSNVIVGPWEEAAAPDDIINPHDGEAYDQMRFVTYNYHRSTSVYSGPVSVTMTQYCRRIRRSRCVVSSTLNFKGMPYAKAFAVHVRWVASRRQKVNLKIQVGLCIVFVEQVLVASQIKVNTMNEMSEAQLLLFRAMKKTLGLAQLNFKDSKTLKKEQHPITRGLKWVFPFAGASTRNDAEIKLREAHVKLARVRVLPKKELLDDQEQQRQHIVEEMDAVHDALDAVLLRKFGAREQVTWKKNIKDSHAKVDNSHSSLADAILRKLCTRRVRVRDPSMFINQKNKGMDQIDLQRRDKTLGKMEVIVSSTIPDVSLQDFADIFLSDDDDDDDDDKHEQGQKGFYARWMRETDRENIEISPWESTFQQDKTQSLIVDAFSGESFTMQRTVKATFNKAKFLRDGSPSVQSSQTQQQYYRLDDPEKRLVFASTTKVENVPFGNSFEVHIRWVVTQLRTAELSVKVGLFVLFQKQVLLEPKIRAGATKEGRRTQLDLFLKVRAALGKVYEERTLVQQTALAEYLTPTPLLCDVVPSPLKWCTPLAPNDVVETNDVLYEEFENAKLKLRAVALFLKESENKGDLEAMKFMLGELNVVNDALDNIVEWHGDKGGTHALDLASFQ